MRNEGRPHDEFLDAILAAISDLRRAQSAMQEAERLNQKYDIQGNARLGGLADAAGDIVEDLEHVAHRLGYRPR